MATVYLALGSNVGDRQAHIALAIRLLEVKLSDIKQAKLYVSKAVGYTDQSDFINTAISAKTKLKPEDLLKFVKDVEKKVGRIERFRWGPREIDIDIIFYDDKIINKPNLTIPHARFKERDFVLQPLCDINPNKIDPVTKLSVSQLLTSVPENERSLLKVA